MDALLHSLRQSTINWLEKAEYHKKGNNSFGHIFALKHVYCCACATRAHAVLQAARMRENMHVVANT